MSSWESVDYKKGMSNPVVIAAILSGTAVVAAMRGRDEAKQHGKDKAGKSMGVGGTMMAAAASVGFLWALSYYGYTEAAWFFLLAPMAVAGVEVFAVIDMLSDLAKEKPTCPPCPQQ
jgi:hypothetical protein